MLRAICRTTALFAVIIASVSANTPAIAGGISQEDLDPLALLHDDHAFVAELSGFVRQPTNGRTGARNGYGWNGASTSGADPSGKSGSLAVKGRAGGNGDCMLKLHQPWARWERRDPKWAAANEFAESRLESLSLDAACSWRFDMGGSAQLRVIGGLRAGGLEVFHQIGFPAHLSFHFKSREVGLGWRAGFSWEDPVDGLRISALYTAPMGFAVSGKQWLQGQPTGADLQADIEMPQTIALRVERDLAPGWHGAIDAQWTEWSAFDGLRVSGVSTGQGTVDASFPTGFTDAVTLKAELEHAVTENWRVAGSLRWDQGVSGGIADLWTIGARVGRSFGPNVDLELTTALGWRMEGSASGFDAVRGASWSYRSEAGPVYGAAVRLKLSF